MTLVLCIYLPATSYVQVFSQYFQVEVFLDVTPCRVVVV